MFFTPESPRWLILNRSDEEGARKIFTLSGANADELIKEIKNSVKPVKEFLFSGKFTKPIILAFLSPTLSICNVCRKLLSPKYAFTFTSFMLVL